MYKFTCSSPEQQPDEEVIHSPKLSKTEFLRRFEVNVLDNIRRSGDPSALADVEMLNSLLGAIATVATAPTPVE